METSSNIARNGRNSHDYLENDHHKNHNVVKNQQLLHVETKVERIRK